MEAMIPRDGSIAQPVADLGDLLGKLKRSPGSAPDPSTVTTAARDSDGGVPVPFPASVLIEAVQTTANENTQPAKEQAESVAFLQSLDPDGRHNLVAIHPETGAIEGRTFPPDSWPEVTKWVSRFNGHRNLYYAPNEPRTNAPDKKLSADDVGFIRAVYADLDPAEGVDLDRARAEIRNQIQDLERGAAPPTLVVDSGGGFNVLWRLSEKLAAAEYRGWAEDTGRALAHALDGDAVQNIDRILRLPGTANLPTPTKLRKGRVERTAQVIHQGDRRYSPADLAGIYPPMADAVRTKASGNAITATDRIEASGAVAAAADEIDMAEAEQCQADRRLPEALQTKFDRALASNDHLRKLWHDGKQTGDASNSGLIASLAAALAPLGFGAQGFADLVAVWPLVDQDRVLDLRSLARVWGRIAADHTPAAIAERWFSHDAQEEPPFPLTAATDANDLYEVLSIGDLYELPDPRFVIGRHIPEQSVGFLYGDPGTGKSFIALDWALHLAFDRPDWHGDAVEQRAGGRVIYLAGEGAAGFKTRVEAWCARHGVANPPDGRFGLVHQSVNFMAADDVRRLVATLRAKFAGLVSMVVVDTVSRSMPGADENLQKEMTLFVAACDLIKRAFGCVVLGVHHAGKSGDMRGSTVLIGAGDFVFKLERKKAAAIGRLHCEKQKDAPDGWSDAYRFDVVPAGEGKSSLVPARCEANIGPGLPLTPDMSNAVLTAMGAAWSAGEPWGRTYHSGERMAAKIMVREFGFDAEQADELVQLWLASGTIAEDTLSKKDKRRGLRVVDRSDRTVAESASEIEGSVFE